MIIRLGRVSSGVRMSVVASVFDCASLLRQSLTCMELSPEHMCALLEPLQVDSCLVGIFSTYRSTQMDNSKLCAQYFV